MNREEALVHFEEQYADKYYLKMTKLIKEYIEENFDKLTIDFIEAFKNLCKKTKSMQQENKKDKISYITFSFGLENLINDGKEYMFHSYGSEWFYEESEECKVTYDASWIYSFLEDTYKELLDISKKYIGNITSDDMAKFKKDGVRYCDVRFKYFAKELIKKAIEIEEFKEIEKEEVLEIRSGEYKGFSEIIYKIDTRVKDSKEIKDWLEEKGKGYSNQIFHNLDLSNGDYSGIRAHNSDFSGSDLSNSNFEGTSLIGSIFKDTKLINVIFHKSRLSQTVVSKADIEKSIFKNSIIIDAKWNNCKINKCDFSCSDWSDGFFEDSTYKDSIFKETEFYGASLTNTVFSNCEFNNASFFETNLQGAKFINCSFEETEFSKVDLTKVEFENSTFKNIKIQEVKVLACDIDKLNLIEDQKKQLYIIK